MNADTLREQLQQPNGADALPKDAETLDTAWTLFLEGNAAACAYLCACAKKQALREDMLSRLEDRAPLYAALSSDKPKLRKNAARLTGALGDAQDAPALIAALQNEATRFVRPSLLLALGAVGGKAAEAALAAYTVEIGEEKHMKEEAEALRLALGRNTRLAKHTFTGLRESRELELRTPKWLAPVCADELRKLGFAPLRVFDTGLRLKTRDVQGLFNARCFFEVLFPLGRCACTPEAVAKLSAPMRELLMSTHAEQAPFGYRMEVKGLEERTDFIRATCALLDSPMLCNAPSDYEAELRVEAEGKLCDVFLKLYTLPDTRFAYRKHTVSAGIHPATAAAVLRSALPCLKAEARVLDPCCGAGTLLFEREKLTPCASLTGVDIAHAAVEAARKNAQAANSRARFVANDMRRFAADRRYDEVVANLPFGNRVGTHKYNEELYAALLDALPQWLLPGGVAVLYTMEFTLLKKLLRAHDDMTLLSQGRTDAGGLTPGVFIVRMSE